MNRTLAVLTGAIVVIAQPCFADSISPSIKDEHKTYSKETPDYAYFGNGPGASLTEASMLRFQAEQSMNEGNYEDALKKLGKAVQFDPGDPEGHLMYARALTSKFYSQKDVDPELLHKCLDEWRLLWHHDADASEQMEAKFNTRKLTRVAKAYEKRMKDKEENKEMVAESAPKSDKDK